MGKIIEFPEPHITGINSEDQITKYYEFEISQSSDRKIPEGSTIDEYKIQLQLYRYIRRKCFMSDGTQRTFTEKDDPHSMFYSLIVDTDKTFGESMEFFKSLGLTPGADISLLQYGKNMVKNVIHPFFENLEKIAEGVKGIEYASKTISNVGKPDEEKKYHQTRFVFGDLDPSFIKEIDDYDKNNGEQIFIRIQGEKETDLEDTALFYEKRTVKGSFGREKIKRIIGYMDDKIVQPRFDQILSAAPFELNHKEKEMLEEMINKALKL